MSTTTPWRPPVTRTRHEGWDMKRAITAIVALAAVAGLVYTIVILTAEDDEGAEEQVIVIDDVGRATLQDTVVVRGSIARDDRFTLSATSPQRVTSVGVEVDDLVAEGDELFRLDGRPMLAVAGTTPLLAPPGALRDRRARRGDAGAVPGRRRLRPGHGQPGVLHPSPGTPSRPGRRITATRSTDASCPPMWPSSQWPATVGEVPVELGDTLSPGQPLVSFVESDLAVSIQGRSHRPHPAGGGVAGPRSPSPPPIWRPPAPSPSWPRPRRSMVRGSSATPARSASRVPSIWWRGRRSGSRWCWPR